MLYSIKLFITASRSFAVIYLCIIYFANAFCKWRTSFKYHSFISFVFLSCCLVCTSSCNSHCFSKKYICIMIIILTRHLHWSLKFNLTIGVISSTKVTFYLNLIFCSKFTCWFTVLSKTFIIFWYSIIILFY